MAQNVEELTFEYRNEEGELLRRQLDKVVLSKGAWATVMYLYQDLDRASGTYKSPKVAIVRYRKSRGVYRKQTSFNISSERQGRMIMEVLERWYATADRLTDAAEAAGQEGGPAPAEHPAPAQTAEAPPEQVAAAGDPPAPEPAPPAGGEPADPDSGHPRAEDRQEPGQDSPGRTSPLGEQESPLP